VDIADVKDMDAVILAVSHEQFKDMTVSDFDKLYKAGNEKVLIDVKALLNKTEFDNAGYVYWRL
jgi:UDP-N-acetyl-D-galactosamine dehydrogenase